MEVTKELMAFLVGTPYEEFPAGVVERGKELIIDFVGGALCGSQGEVGKRFSEYVREKGGRPEATVIGKNYQTTAAYASYLNGCFDHALELEAVSQRTSPNPLAVIAVCLALGEKNRLSGRQVLEGLVLGYEIQAKVGGAAMAGVSKNGRVSIFNHLGATSAAIRLLGLDSDQARSALGIASFQAGGLMVNTGTTAHILELAAAGRDGIESAELAARGFTGHPNIIETPQGFLEALVEPGKYELARITQDLGRPYQIVDPGISIKKYPCCYRSHRAVDGLLEIQNEQQVGYAEIEKVVADVNAYDLLLTKFPHPLDIEEAKFSFHQILGAAILKGKVWLESFTDASLTDPKYREARNKIEVVFHPDWPPGRVEARTPVTVILKDGRVFTKDITTAREPNRDQLLDRYRLAAEGVLPPDRIEKTLDIFLHLDQLRDLSEVMQLLKVA